MSDLKINSNNITSKSFLNNAQKEIIRRIELINLIKTYKKNLIKTKTQSSSLRLPKLSQSNSHRKITLKQHEKINLLKFKQKNNLGGKKFNFDNLSDLNHQKENHTFRNTIKSKKNTNLNNRNKLNKNFNNSPSLLYYNSNLKTTENINSNNRVRIYKIKNFENNKVIVDDFNKVNNEYFILKKNYYIRKNNVNMDIFNLINNNNYNIFNHTISKTPKDDIN